RLGIVALVYSFFVICFPRVYLGIHYPTDIVGGALIGITMAFWIKLSPLTHGLGAPLPALGRPPSGSVLSFLLPCRLGGFGNVWFPTGDSQMGTPCGQARGGTITLES